MNAFVVVSSAIVALLALVVNEEVPVIASAIPCVMLSVVAVIFRFPPTAPSVLALMYKSPSALADEFSFTAALSTNVIFPKTSLPVSASRVTAFENALPDESRAISDPDSLVLKVAAPVIVNAPLSVILPVVAVAAKFPPTVDAARFNPASLTTVASPVPFVVS
ncbi:MAG: hypothetical protein HN474_11035 [Nitrospina sp.]|nr:hypothetical protein [Nitrospina sp.]